MKVLVTGANGQLGFDTVQLLRKLGVDVYGIRSSELDLTDMERTSSYIMRLSPTVIIHCAAYTNVDRAETEVEKCRIMNVDVTANLASLSQQLNAKMVYISTDYVFSGEDLEPYEVDSILGPLSIYGQTKLQGEIELSKVVTKHFIVRTSWAYGINGNNFVKTMLRLSEENKVINVVSDQVGSPTYTKDLAELISSMILTDKYGIYHATNEGFCSWAEFATEILRRAGKSTVVNAINSDQYPTLAIRPKNSKLSKSSLDQAGFNRLPKWQNAVERYLDELGISSL